MTDPIPDEAVEAALDVRDGYPDSPGCDDAVIGALEAAAPHIAKQATVDLRARIEALRDEWRATRNAALVEVRRDHTRYEAGELVGRAVAHGGAADALDALLRGAK